MICVLATIELAEGRRDEFLTALRNVVPSVRAEEGCIEYGPWLDVPTSIADQPPSRQNTVMVVEKWESVEALEAHLMTPHMLDFFRATEPLRLGVSLQILKPA